MTTQLPVRRSIANHLNFVFGNLPEGTFLTVAQISHTMSPEYGADRPSPGAICARLFPTNIDKRPEGLLPMTLGGVKGAMKVGG